MSSGMAEPRYYLDTGEVWFSSGSGPAIHICSGSQRLALAVDPEGVLFKHGAAEQVSGWADTQRAKPGLAEMLPFEVIIFPVNEPVLEELNRCLATSGRARGFKDFLGSLSAEDFGPQYPE
jgi:hypothetical protein